MDLGLTGKVALVTGGSRTIGYSIARRLGMEGAKVAICARGERNLLGAVEKLRAEGVDAWGRVAASADSASSSTSRVATSSPGRSVLSSRRTGGRVSR